MNLNCNCTKNGIEPIFTQAVIFNIDKNGNPTTISQKNTIICDRCGEEPDYIEEKNNDNIYN